MIFDFNKINIIKLILLNQLILLNFLLILLINIGIGGDWGLGIGPNPQSPIPNPQSPIPIFENLILYNTFIYN